MTLVDTHVLLDLVTDNADRPDPGCAPAGRPVAGTGKRRSTELGNIVTISVAMNQDPTFEWRGVAAQVTGTEFPWQAAFDTGVRQGSGASSHPPYDRCGHTLS